MGLFGKTKAPDPKEQVQEWSRKIRKEGHQLDRQINQIKREEMKATRSIKECAKRGDKESARVLAKEVVASRKAVNRIYTAKANLSSVEMQMRNQASQLRLAGSLQKSSEVMKSMQQLVKLPELQKTMMELSKEMTKAGIIEEMVEDTMEMMEDTDELEDDVQTEVDKVLNELTTDVGKKLASAPKVSAEASISLPEPGEVELEAEDGDEVQEDLDEMQERLQALKS